MMNIVLACQYGASTDLLAVKMQEAAKRLQLDAVINAYSFTRLEQVVDAAGLVLLGPQIRFKKKTLQEQFKDRNVEIMVVNTVDYGMLNGEKVLLDAIAEIQKKENRNSH